MADSIGKANKFNPVFDIPANMGIEAQYWAEENTGGGIPVNIGIAGPDQSWDFTGVDSSTQFSQYITALDSTPYSAQFPNSNLVIEFASHTSTIGLKGPSAPLSNRPNSPGDWSQIRPLGKAGVGSSRG